LTTYTFDYDFESLEMRKTRQSVNSSVIVDVSARRLEPLQRSALLQRCASRSPCAFAASSVLNCSAEPKIKQPLETVESVRNSNKNGRNSNSRHFETIIITIIAMI
jgi:hypothetical protein